MSAVERAKLYVADVLKTKLARLPLFYQAQVRAYAEDALKDAFLIGWAEGYTKGWNDRQAKGGSNVV